MTEWDDITICFGPPGVYPLEFFRSIDSRMVCEGSVQCIQLHHVVGVAVSAIATQPQNPRFLLAGGNPIPCWPSNFHASQGLFVDYADIVYCIHSQPNDPPPTAARNKDCHNGARQY